MEPTQTKLEMDSQSIQLWGGVILSALSLVCTVLNTLLLIAVIKDPLKKLRRLSNYLLIHLIACDMTVGLISTPLMSCITFRLKEWKNTDPYYITKAMAFIFVYAEYLTALFLCRDRYHSIVTPIQHRGNTSSKRYVKTTIATWVLSFIMPVDIFLGKASIIVGAIKLIFLTISTVAVLIIIYFRVRNVLTRRDDKEEPLLTGGHHSGSLTRIRESKQVISLLTLIIVWQLFTLIVLASTEIYYQMNVHDPSFVHRHQIIEIVHYMMYTLNPIFNAVVCIIKMSDFRKSIKALFIHA